MAGRHRRPPAWRRLLMSMVRSRDRVRTAALQAEVVALRATVAQLRDELAQVQARAAEAAGLADARWVTMQLPLVQLALGDLADVVRDPDPAPGPADRLAWTVLANLPEGPLLDPRSDRDAEPRDPAAAAVPAEREHRRTA